MANLDEMIASVAAEGYNQANAAARVCQDIVLKAISASGFSDHIAVKGGVVMCSITGDVRRATQDMDLDFIRYSLGEEKYCPSRTSCIWILVSPRRHLMSRPRYN